MRFLSKSYRYVHPALLALLFALLSTALQPLAVTAQEGPTQTDQVARDRAKDDSSSNPTAPWLGQEKHIETILLEGTVVSRKRVGRGVTNPWKVVLEYQGETLAAIFKPLRRGFTSTDRNESYQAEVAAYRLSHHIGLDRVPPTVERKIGRDVGSLQMWVDGYRQHFDIADQYPPDPRAWSEQLANMKMFDELIDNPDRHDANYLVGENWDLVLIDHSRALSFDRQGRARAERLPVRFDRGLFEKVRELDLDELEALLGDLYRKTEMKSILANQKKLITYVDELVSERGDIVFFGRPIE